MNCDACEFPLDGDDNYCRNCGAAVLVAPLPAVRGDESQVPALFRAAATPVVTGAVTVAGAALLRWAMGQALRGAAGGRRREVYVPPRALSRREAALEPGGRRGALHSVEVFWYRRTYHE